MAYGFTGYGGYSRPSAPGRLTLEELLGMQEAFVPPEKPKPVARVRDLPEDERKQARMDSLWAGMAALGAGASSGDWGRAAQGGVANIQDIQGRSVAEANARQEQALAAQQEQAQRDAVQARATQEKKALFGMYEEVAEGESEAFVSQAEQAARAGSMAELEKLREQKPQRAAARLKGLDPDVWDTNKRLEAELAAEIERTNKEKAWAGEKARQEEELKAKADAELQARIEQRDQGVLWQPRESPAEAAAKADAVARVQARYAKQEGGAGGVKGQLYKQGEQIVFATPPDATNPRGKVVPLDGQPETVGNLVYFTLGGARYVQDKRDPSGTAFEAPVVGKGEPGWRPGGTPLPAPQKKTGTAAPEASHILNTTVADLVDGSLSEAEALSLLKASTPPGGWDGFTAEQILARAKQLAAAKRRGR